MLLFLVAIGWQAAEEGLVVSVKGRIVGKAAAHGNVNRTLAASYHLPCQKQSFFSYVFLGRTVQLLFEPAEKIALADEKVICYFFDALHGANFVVDVLQCL